MVPGCGETNLVLTHVQHDDPLSAPVRSPRGQIFETYPEFLAAIAPGMRLCTSGFTGWGEVTGTTERSVLGTRDSDGAGAEVPQEALLDIRGGHCVRLDRTRATIDRQGWEI